ncbi:hypothetical protein AAFC00_006016 [Neodothiora populina]|uniref:ABC transporter domain-containing protein n=1 Tax=Neodothiora populina TaxID=2781224 RepID=A0ABR3P6Z7_9PEZI
MVILGLSYVEDTRSKRPSSLLAAYLVFSIVFDAAQIRTLWLIDIRSIASVQIASILTRVMMLVVKSRSKVSYLKQPYCTYPPESSSGLLNLSFVWWLNGLFFKGSRTLMTSNDLYDIDENLKAEVLAKRIKDAWDNRVQLRGQFALPIGVMGCLRRNLLAAVVPRLCMIGFRFCQPFLITSAIDYMGKSADNRIESHAYGLIGAAFLVYFGVAMSTVHFKQCFARVTIMFRGAMISLLYNQTLILQESSCADNAALTLMSTDVDNIIEFLENINEIWACSIEIAIETWLLDLQLGAICIVPLVVVLACVAGQTLVAKTIGHNQQKWNQAIQHRVKNTSSMLVSLKEINISGLTEKLELAVQARIEGKDSLTPVKVFTSLSIITLVTTPAAKLLAVLPQIAAVQGCFKRLQIYLVSDVRKDGRSHRMTTEAPALSPCDHSQESSMIELTRLTANPAGKLNAIVFENATVIPSMKAHRPAIVGASFSVPTASFTAVTGPVGSGKTILMKAVLGEIGCESGHVFVASTHISYCSQTSWIWNASIRDNICGRSKDPIDEKWYSTVIQACALDRDLSLWPKGDATIVGSKGLTLSGGQRQRVALARTVYA